MMVYYLCKLVRSGKYKESEVIAKLTVANDKSKQCLNDENNPISKVISFSMEKDGFITENDEGIFETIFTERELTSFRAFMEAVVEKLELNDGNKFNKMLQWLLTEKQVLSKYARAEDFVTGMNMEGVDSNTVHGFLFWCEAMGIINFEGKRSGTVVYTLDDVLFRFIENNPELKELGAIPFREFVDALTEKIYYIPMCLDYNNVSYPLSLAIRALERAGVIELRTITDSGDKWHLSQSATFTSGNEFTNIKVL